MMNDHFPPSLSLILQRELACGEQVVWQARPSPVSFVTGQLGTFLTGIPVFALSYFLTLSAAGNIGDQRSSGSIFPHSLMLVICGVIMLNGVSILLSPLWAWWVARHTLYVITDRRAVLIEAPFRRTIQSFAGEQLATIIRSEDSRGRGSIIFKREAFKSGWAGGTDYREVGFFGLADAKAAEQIVLSVYANTRNA